MSSDAAMPMLFVMVLMVLVIVLMVPVIVLLWLSCAFLLVIFINFSIVSFMFSDTVSSSVLGS